MESIGGYYQIVGSTPFRNLKVWHDNVGVLDSEKIRRATAYPEVVALACRCLDTFADAMVADLLDSSANSSSGLLDCFHEPREMRLGMAKEGFYGNGGGVVVGSLLRDSLTGETEALVRVGVLRQIGDIPLFVKGIGDDITSDITGRIVYLALADFTRRMLEEYPEFSAPGHEVKVFQRQVWLPDESRWGLRDVLMPVVDGEPLLLIPEEWVGKRLLMSGRRYYGTSVLSYVQSEGMSYTPEGEPLKTPKNVLMLRSDLRNVAGTNRAVTLRALDTGENLVAKFRCFVDQQELKKKRRN